MVIFDQLRLSDDATKLYVTAHVNTAQYMDNTSPFKDVYIKRVVVSDANKITEMSDLDTIVNRKKYLVKQDYGDGDYKKSIDLVFDANNFERHDETEIKKIDFCGKEMLTTLFFVFIETTDAGAAGACLPCYMQNKVTVGATFDENLLFQNVMNYTRELADDCNIPSGFIDFILRWNAFKAAIATDHYLPAVKYYNMLFGGSNSTNTTGTTRGCGCHG